MAERTGSYQLEINRFCVLTENSNYVAILTVDPATDVQ